MSPESVEYSCEHAPFFILLQGNGEVAEESQLLDGCGSGAGAFLPVSDPI